MNNAFLGENFIPALWRGLLMNNAFSGENCVSTLRRKLLVNNATSQFGVVHQVAKWVMFLGSCCAQI